jgi:hypothetical protein
MLLSAASVEFAKPEYFFAVSVMDAGMFAA